MNKKMKPEGVTLTFKMAEAILENEKLGTGDVTDMLCVSISGTDAIAHEYGTRGAQTKGKEKHENHRCNETVQASEPHDTGRS